MSDVALTAAVAFGALLPVVQPFGALPVFYSLTRSGSDAERRRAARTVAVSTFAVLVGALITGRFVLHFFGISLGALGVAGGLLVAFAGWQMIRYDPAVPTAEGMPTSLFTPMVMPLLAGPGAIGVVIAHSSRADVLHDYPGQVVGFAAIAAVVFAMFVFGERLLDRLGPGGISAVSQVFGLITIAIGAELVLHGAIETGTVYNHFH